MWNIYAVSKKRDQTDNNHNNSYCLLVNYFVYNKVMPIIRTINTPKRNRRIVLLNVKIQTCSSWSVKPRPDLTRVLYLNEGHRTTGLKLPPTGLGAMRRAFLIRLSLLRFFLAGWLNHVLTYLCQSLWKWPFGIMLLRFGAMIHSEKTGCPHITKMIKLRNNIVTSCCFKFYV